ncbi:MAG: zinc ABC transporter substrate-binding protein [Bacteroidales bacterium]
MNLSVFVPPLLLLIVFVTGCGTSTSNNKIVSVTIMPQKYFADKISGGLTEVNCIVPSGANPENYDPAPMEIIATAKSSAYFKVGNLGFEMATLSKIAENNPSMKIFDTSRGIDPLKSHYHPVGDECFDKGEDPHIWVSPKAAKIISHNMLLGFIEIDSVNKNQYIKNYNQLIAQIDSVDKVVTKKLSKHVGGIFAIFHPSLSYFARDYGLRQLTLEKNGKELTAIYFKEAIEAAKASGVEVVYIQKEFNPSQVETFAAEVGVKIIVIDPLDYNWVDETIKIADAFE